MAGDLVGFPVGWLVSSRDDTGDVLYLDVVIAAPTDLVWRALADPTHRRAWWSYLDLDARPGGTLTEHWRDAQGLEHATYGTVLEVEPCHRLRCSWRDDDWPVETELEITLHEEGGATSFRLRHAGWQRLANGTHLLNEHRAGWEGHLTDLKGYAERLAV